MEEDLSCLIDSYEMVSSSLKNVNLKQISINNLKKHDSTIVEYNKNKVDNIIFDEKKKIVSLFKDSLLWNEPTELLRRYSYIYFKVLYY